MPTDPRINVRCGDVLDAATDGLISSGNVKLEMAGGVSAALHQRSEGHLQRQLFAALEAQPRPFVEPGFAIALDPGPLPWRAVVYCVAIDGFYQSSPALVTTAVAAALRLAREAGCESTAMPALATGYGPLDMTAFGRGLSAAWQQLRPDERPAQLEVMVPREADRDAVQAALAS